MSRDAIPDLVTFSARGQDGSGAILRRGDAISVFPQTAAASTPIDVSQARGLLFGTAALTQVQQPVGHLPSFCAGSAKIELDLLPLAS